MARPMRVQPWQISCASTWKNIDLQHSIQNTNGVEQRKRACAGIKSDYRRSAVAHTHAERLLAPLFARTRTHARTHARAHTHRHAHHSLLKWNGVSPSLKGTSHAGPPSTRPLHFPASTRLSPAQESSPATTPPPLAAMHAALQSRNSFITTWSVRRKRHEKMRWQARAHLLCGFALTCDCRC